MCDERAQAQEAVASDKFRPDLGRHLSMLAAPSRTSPASLQRRREVLRVVSLSYTEVRPRRAISAARRSYTRGRQWNWTLIIALALNVVVWGSILILMAQLN